MEAHSSGSHAAPSSLACKLVRTLPSREHQECSPIHSSAARLMPRRKARCCSSPCAVARATRETTLPAPRQAPALDGHGQHLPLPIVDLEPLPTDVNDLQRASSAVACSCCLTMLSAYLAMMHGWADAVIIACILVAVLCPFVIRHRVGRSLRYLQARPPKSGAVNKQVISLLLR